MAKDNRDSSIPIWNKMNLTFNEAVLYSNIGENKLREIINNPLCSFVMNVGNRKLIKRKEFEEWNSKNYYI